jgi:hypothetical protein
MTRLKDILLENGSLTDATDGFDSTEGTTPTLDTTSQIKGANSMRCQSVDDVGVEDFTAVDTVYVSGYIKMTTLPASAQIRLIFIYNTATALAQFRITSAGAPQLRDGANTQIGANGPTVSTGTIYRCGLRYTKGTGANAVLEAYIATGDADFGAAFASSSVEAATLQANKVRFGQVSAGTVCDLFVDDIRIDDAAMPGPSTGGAPPPSSIPPRILSAIYR